jgi:RimJ/RimL family protein N-acetyltransferase
MLGRSWFPDRLAGPTVVLRRHDAANLAAFRRWYADPEVARLTRYQDGPMRSEDIERFFEARVVGLDSLAMAIHVRETEQLIGTCAFSQLDGDNGSALFHITIGEKRAWGMGYGTEATRLMLEHAFSTLGLHRVGLAVFEFNERAIRTYRRCGFVVEGRAREAIWRDGRFWDEIQMSILDTEWRAITEDKPRAVDENLGPMRSTARARSSVSVYQSHVEGASTTIEEPRRRGDETAEPVGGR